MFPRCPDPLSTRARKPNRARSGLTLVELLVAAAIMAIVVAALATLSRALYAGAEYGGGHGEAIQHARVALERITRLANEATTSPEFPGMIVVAAQQGGYQYPDTLVVWHPAAVAADPAGRPRFNELVIFCTKADQPNERIELTAPGDTRIVPEYDDLNDWAEEIDNLKSSSSTRQTVLTNLVRTAFAGSGASGTELRGCVRFNVRMRPADDNDPLDCDLEAFHAGRKSWEDLPWVQNIYSHSLGLRQGWLRIELQLTPGDQAHSDQSGARAAIPFFDSAAVHYTLRNDS